jgi:hypothetical protein
MSPAEDNPFGSHPFGDAPFGPRPDAPVQPPEGDNFARTSLHPIGHGFTGTMIVSMLHPIEAGICA